MAQKSIDDFIKFGPLNYENYGDWFERARDCLALSDLWIYICNNNQQELNDDPQTAQANHKIKAILKMGVDDKLKKELDNFKNGKNTILSR